MQFQIHDWRTPRIVQRFGYLDNATTLTPLKGMSFRRCCDPVVITRVCPGDARGHFFVRGDTLGNVRLWDTRNLDGYQTVGTNSSMIPQASNWTIHLCTTDYYRYLSVLGTALAKFSLIRTRSDIIASSRLWKTIDWLSLASCAADNPRVIHHYAYVSYYLRPRPSRHQHKTPS